MICRSSHIYVNIGTQKPIITIRDRPYRYERHFECRICSKNQFKRYGTPFTPHVCAKYRSCRYERHFECRMSCKNQYKRYIGLRAFTSISEPKIVIITIIDNSRMHEISTTPMRKALGVTTYRSSHIDVKLHESSGRSQSLTGHWCGNRRSFRYRRRLRHRRRG